MKTKTKASNSSGAWQDKASLRLDEHRVAELLNFAKEEFLANGFAAASVSNIARRAKASKTTFYARFPNKEQLFLAVMERLMKPNSTEILSSLQEGLPLKEALRRHAETLLKFALREEQISLNRIATMEAERFPSLVEQFFELGPRRDLVSVTDYFARRIKTGELVDENPKQMSEHYFSLLFGGSIRWTTLRHPAMKYTSAKLAEHIEGLLKVFLRAYSTGGYEERMKR
jgi:AcrR family transcriptional regulator